jgi:uncharacterized membrane protein YkgB
VQIFIGHLDIKQSNHTGKMKSQSNQAEEIISLANIETKPRSGLTKLAIWFRERNFAFLIGSISLSVMLLWGGLFKWTSAGADGITPLVSNSPLISWHFKIFGPYIGSDLIGLTEMTGAILILAGHYKPKIGIVGSLIAALMFFVTSTMFITTPGTVAPINGIGYMTPQGLFLFKDIVSLSVALFLVSNFGQKAALIEDKN